MVVCQWKRKDGVKPETWNFGLFYGGGRIYAIDSNALQRHKNIVGLGRPYFRKVVHGIHEHRWSEDGQGYAEPFTLESINGPAIWKAFVARASISDPGFVHPDKAINDGQQEFDI